MLPTASTGQKANECGIARKPQFSSRDRGNDTQGITRDRFGIETASSGSRRRHRPALIGRRHGKTLRVGTGGGRRYDPPVGSHRTERPAGKLLAILAMASDDHPILDNFNIFDRWDVDEKERPARKAAFRERCATKSASASPDPARRRLRFSAGACAGVGLYPQNKRAAVAPASVSACLASHVAQHFLPGVAGAGGNERRGHGV